jgi:hypothetical protein
MKLIDLLNEIKVKAPSMLLTLIENNLEFIKEKFYIKTIESIELIGDDPQEVEMIATIDDGDDPEVGDELKLSIIFRFLEDAENDENFVSDYGLDYIVRTLDGIRVAAIELEY